MFGKTFSQVNNRHVVKEQYNPVNTELFSQPRFYSCQKHDATLSESMVLLVKFQEGPVFINSEAMYEAQLMLKTFSNQAAFCWSI